MIPRTNAIDFFDIESSSYGKRYINNNTLEYYNFNRRRTLINSLLQNQKPTKILDIGCGSGEILHSILKNQSILANIKEVSLLDSSEAMLEKARTRIHSVRSNITVHMTKIVVGQIPFNNCRNYQLILCLGLLAYLEKLIPLIDIVSDSTSNEGLVVLQMSLKNHIFNIIFRLHMTIRKLFSSNTEREDEFLYENFYSVKELDQIMNTYGFKKINSIKYGFDIPGFTKRKIPKPIIFSLSKLDTLLGTDILLMYQKVSNND